MAHSWNDRFHQIIQQTRVIQIAMNSIENQSPQKLEMKKTCIGMAVAHSRQVHHSQVWDPEFIHAKVQLEGTHRMHLEGPHRMQKFH